MTPLTNVAEININYAPALGWNNQPHIVTSLDAYVIIKNYFPEETIHLQESFVVLYLNQANRVIGVYKMSKGGITGTVADNRLILATALKIVSTSFIIAHNHPSGNNKPSPQDIQLTSKVKEAARLLDIQLIDHLIVTPLDGEYYSFADDGNL